MAEAKEQTIPCERCKTQISLDDWSLHSRQCIHGEKRPNQTTDNINTNEPTTDGIPCEYCSAQINLDDWSSHTKQCADAHQHRMEILRNGWEDVTIVELIPCEYCDAQINVHDWEVHSKRCAKINKSTSSNKENSNRSELIPCEYCDAQIDVNDWELHSRQCAKIKKPTTDNTEDNIGELIPCEYCAGQVSIQDWTRHTKNCADAERKRIEDIVRRAAREASDAVIPCEYCDKSFTLELIEDHQTKCRRKAGNGPFQPNALHDQPIGGIFHVPQHWDQSSPNNLSQHTLEPDTEEYKFVADNFHKTLPQNQITRIQRIQNRRWYRQYDAHKDDFTERYGTSTEQWLFHGCKGASTEAIIKDCFNRSHAVRCAAGQGIYFAVHASTSLSYTQPDADKLRHMFMARVLVGKTTGGNPAMRVCPPGFDTTGGGTVFVTYHDAQAYGEYLITFR